MTPQDQRLITEQVQRASYVTDALYDLLKAANGERISAISVMTLLEPLRDGLHTACDTLDRDKARHAHRHYL